MARLRDFYFLLFYFWVRLDLFTKTRENKALKALVAVALVQLWLLLGSYMWGQILLGFPSPPAEAFFAVVAALFVGNYAILRRRGWEEFERRFVLYSRRARWAWMAVAGGANIAAFALLLSAAIVARSARLANG
jgi:TRAP-type C4-dicarboxylate transport system permease large subunit